MRLVAAAVAVDTLEHISSHERAGVISEMARVTSPRGRASVGPVGKAAAAGDARLLTAAQTATRDVSWVEWLHEHEGHGLPSVDDLVSLLLDVGAQRITARGLFNIRLWKVMHLVGLRKAAGAPRPGLRIALASVRRARPPVPARAVLSLGRYWRNVNVSKPTP